MITVPVGPFPVADVNARVLPSYLVSLARESERPVTAFALHVGGLNEARNRRFVADMQSADVVYADGAATVLAARAAGAKKISRAATTDIGPEVVRALAASMNRPTKVALIGGPPGLAEAAAQTLIKLLACEIVFVADGYARSVREHCPALNEAAPDVLFVGLGMPLEARAVVDCSAQLPDCLVMTCGGWFGFLAGEETRAPKMLQVLGLEWTWRFLQAPRRLGPRYARGAWIASKNVATAWYSRVAGVSRS